MVMAQERFWPTFFAQMNFTSIVDYYVMIVLIPVTYNNFNKLKCNLQSHIGGKDFSTRVGGGDPSDYLVIIILKRFQIDSPTPHRMNHYPDRNHVVVMGTVGTILTNI